MVCKYEMNPTHQKRHFDEFSLTQNACTAENMAAEWRKKDLDVFDKSDINDDRRVIRWSRWE